MIYDYVGPGSTANSKVYRITLMLFRDQNCANCAAMPTEVTIGIFNNDNNILFGSVHTVPLSNTEIIPINALPPCITNPPVLNYTVGTYTFTVQLDDNNTGYTAAYQTCCRIDNIQNVPDAVGAT